MNKNADKFKAAGAEVIAVFREEKKGVDGLEMIKKKSKSEFVLALDNGNKQTSGYSPEKMNFSSYVVGKDGIVKEIVKGDLRNRAKSDQLLTAVNALSKPNSESPSQSGGESKAGSDNKTGSGKH